MSTGTILPFSSINPIKCIGLNQSNPFCSIISQGKLIYTSGTNIIMENTKTNQQKILFNNNYRGQIELIHHHVTLYNEHILAIAIKDSITLMHIMVIIPLNPIIFNQEAKKEKNYTHFLRNIEQFQQIKGIQFFDEGSLFAVLSTYQSLNNLSLIRTSSGQVTYQQSFIDAKISIKPACLSKTNCISVLQHGIKGQIRLCLIVLDELSRKFYFNLALQKQEKIIEYFYEGYQEDNIMLALTNLGHVLIYKINQYEIILINRVDVRQVKRLHQTQQNQQKCHKRQIQITQEKDCHYYLPITIQHANNKVIIAYEESCIIGLLFYSHYNPKNTKFSLIQQALGNFNFVKEIKSIKMAKDNCSLAALIEIYPQKVQLKSFSKQNEESPLNTQQITAFQLQNDHQEGASETDIAINIPAIEIQNNNEEFTQKQYIALQIDILSNMIDHQQQAYSTQQTFSLLSGHNLVIKVEYCTYNNTMFLLMKNKMIKYYDLTPKEHQNKFQKNIPMYKQFKIKGLLLWEQLLSAQPLSMTVHPFNYTILLVYQQILKFHYFNIKNLFPAFIITSIKNCNMAKYSPLGEKIVLATTGAVIILNSYTYEVMKTISLPNILTQTQLKRISSVRQKLPTLKTNPKLITDFTFLKNGDLLIFSGHNSFSLILNNEKASHFGFLQLNQQQKFSQILYDSVNNLVILLQENDILVLAKSNINTKNRCEVISKIQISASSAYLIQQLGILFVGGKDGVLHVLKWPDYCQEQLYMRNTNKYFQYRQPIISINVSSNYNYIYTVSKSGSFCISQLQVSQNDEDLPKDIRTLLLTTSQKPLRHGNRWLISRSEEERKEREIIKLRGQQVDLINHHNQMAKKQEIKQDELISIKKAQLEAQYAKELKQYEEKLGLQKNIQSITLLKDQSKIFLKKKSRQIYEIASQKQEKMKLIFEQRTKLQKQYKSKIIQNQKHIQSCIEQNQEKIYNLKIQLQSQQQTLIMTGKQSISKETDIQYNKKCNLSHLQEDHIEEMHVFGMEHQCEISDLLDKNQAILSKNRNKNIEIHDYQDKIGDLNIQKQKLQFDMYKIIDEKQRYEQLRQKILQENEHHKRTYDKLIKVSKELEDKVIYQRKEQKSYQYKISTLEQEVALLNQRDRSLEQKRTKVNENFIEEKDMNAAKANAITQLNRKCQQLKDLKKQQHYKNCLLKNQYSQIIKTFMRNLQIDEQNAIIQICEAYRSPTFQKKKESVINNDFQFLKAQHEKMAQNAQKWKDVKQSYMNSFYRNHKKLDQQNLKLTYRYNDLLRLSQQYKVQISHLQQHIEKLQRSNSDWKSLPKVTESRFGDSRAKSNYSFLNVKKQNKPNKSNLKKKLICVSLHQQSGKFITQA